MPYGDGVITDVDVRAAQTALDTLTAGMEQTTHLDLLQWRGILAGVMADMRVTGYLQGVQDGRQQVGGLLRRALEEIVAGEGL